MGFNDLSDFDRRLYEYIKGGDFESKPWSSPKAAEKLGVDEDAIFESLSNLAKHVKDNIWIYYKDGALRVVAE